MRRRGEGFRLSGLCPWHILAQYDLVDVRTFGAVDASITGEDQGHPDPRFACQVSQPGHIAQVQSLVNPATGVAPTAITRHFSPMAACRRMVCQISANVISPKWCRSLLAPMMSSRNPTGACAASLPRNASIAAVLSAVNLISRPSAKPSGARTPGARAVSRPIAVSAADRIGRSPALLWACSWVPRLVSRWASPLGYQSASASVCR